jgi:CheY-like chemotaxis protein
MVELALDDDLAQEQRDRLRLVHDSARSLLAIINDLLDLAKIEAGKFVLDPNRFALREEVEQTLRSLALRAQERGLALACTIAPEVPAYVVGDPDRLRQVLVNLVGNAIKFTDKGGVAVRMRAAPGPGPRVVFEIEDTGIGIPPERLRAIFVPFEQADPSTTRRFGGTGLGLTIASRLVGLMGGEIGVASEVGVGSTFTFDVLFAPVSADTPPRRAAPPPLSARAAGRRRLEILLAEDNPINQRVAVEILKRMGHTVTVVNDGRAAVEAVEGRPLRPGVDGRADADHGRLAGDGGDPPQPARARATHPRGRADGPRDRRRPQALHGARHGRLLDQAAAGRRAAAAV